MSQRCVLSDRHDDADNPFGGYRPDGLYVFGPKGPICVLALLVYFTYCARTSAATPDGERRQRIVGKAQDALRAAQRWRDDPDSDSDDEMALYYTRVLELAGEWKMPQVGHVGRFTRPRKPAASGRKRRAA